MLDTNHLWRFGLPSVHGADFGHYDQCLAIRGPRSQFTGKYCLFKLDLSQLLTAMNYTTKVELNATWTGKWFDEIANNYFLLYYVAMTSSVCFPSTCSGQEVEHLINKQLIEMRFPANISMNQLCDTISDFELDLEAVRKFPIHQKVSIAILLIIISLVWMATLDIYLFPDRKRPQWLLHFDVVANAMKLFQRRPDRDAVQKYGNCVTEQLK